MTDVTYHARMAIRLCGNIVAVGTICAVIFVLLVILP